MCSCLLYWYFEKNFIILLVLFIQFLSTSNCYAVRAYKKKTHLGLQVYGFELFLICYVNGSKHRRQDNSPKPWQMVRSPEGLLFFSFSKQKSVLDIYTFKILVFVKAEKGKKDKRQFEKVGTIVMNIIMMLVMKKHFLHKRHKLSFFCQTTIWNFVFLFCLLT